MPQMSPSKEGAACRVLISQTRKGSMLCSHGNWQSRNQESCSSVIRLRGLGLSEKRTLRLPNDNGADSLGGNWVLFVSLTPKAGKL